jgi:protein gp37
MNETAIAWTDRTWNPASGCERITEGCKFCYAPDSYRDQIVDIIEATPQHSYQVLTKRPAAMVAYAARRKLPSNFWAGVTIEANRHVGRADLLRQVDVPVRFISAEPLLDGLDDLDLAGIAWLIVGGESGTHLHDRAIRTRRALVEQVGRQWQPRVDRAEWVRSLRHRCEAARVAFFFKQWGGLIAKSTGAELDGHTVQEFPA